MQQGESIRVRGRLLKLTVSCCRPAVNGEAAITATTEDVADRIVLADTQLLHGSNSGHHRNARHRNNDVSLDLVAASIQPKVKWKGVASNRNTSH